MSKYVCVWVNTPGIWIISQRDLHVVVTAHWSPNDRSYGELETEKHSARFHSEEWERVQALLDLLLLLPNSWHVFFLLPDAKWATLPPTLTKIIGKMLNKRLQIYFVLCHTNKNNHYVYLCAIQNVIDLCCWWTPLITEKLAEALANKCYVCVASR